MCGIAGLIGLIEPDDRRRIAAASCALAHRGPDADRIWASSEGGPGAILAHRRLSIIDLSEAADQPMIDPASGVAIVFNGEIYNFGALRSELAAAGRTFATAGDTEVIVQGYLHWGEAVVRRLRGMFTLVLYDPVRRRALFARDGHGIKPLYTAAVRGPDGTRAIAFASEVRALLATGYVRRETDSARVHRYLWDGFAPGPQTMVRGIDAFPRGSHATVELADTRLVPERFWALGGSQPSVALDAAAAETAIADSVAAHLVADVKLGVFLSGGIDSSAVSALAARAASGPIDTLAIGFDESDADESRIAAEVALRIGTNHATVVITPGEMLERLDAAADALDQPSLDGINSWFVSRAARQAGWKVALAGTGGDELFGGYTSFRRLPRLMRATRGLAPVGDLLRQASGLIDGGLSIRAKLLDLAAAGGDPARLYQILYALYASRTAAGLIDAPPAALDRWGLEPARLDDLTARAAALPPLRAVSLLESELFLGDRLLRDTDAVSMAHSLEVRVPLVDTALSDAMAGVSDTTRYGAVGTKPLLRGIAERACGREVFDRPKRGFEFPFETWLRGALREPVGALLLDRDRCHAIGLRPERVGALWHAFLDRPGRVYWTRIWSTYMLLRWSGATNVRCAA